ncbi:MAG: hypothetical protein PVH22_15805 [Desulfobacteraceae bacterium]
MEKQPGLTAMGDHMKPQTIFTAIVVFISFFSLLHADDHTRIIGSWQVVGENCDDTGNHCQPENSPILTFTEDGFLIKNKDEKKAPFIIKDDDIIVMNQVIARIISLNDTILILKVFELNPTGKIKRLKKVTGKIEDIMKEW